MTKVTAFNLRSAFPFGLSKALLFFLFSFVLTSTPVKATEVAKQFYLLGSKASMAGFVPPPGTYVGAINYYYTGDASGAAANSVILDDVGKIDIEAQLNLDSRAFVLLPNALWVAPNEILGGNLGLGGLLVLPGWQDTSANIGVNASITLPDGTMFTAGDQFRVRDKTTAAGDPILMALLGWHEGNWHWNVQALLNVPIGSYSVENISNIGFNRWALDLSAGATWLDPARGHEISAFGGFTFNGENPDTDYKTGTEFHIEFAAMQHFSQSIAFGLAGFHFQQVTGDSGAGATLGNFKGRATALGPNLSVNFALGKIPVSTQMHWYWEFNVKNRLKGSTGMLTLTVPVL